MNPALFARASARLSRPPCSGVSLSAIRSFCALASISLLASGVTQAAVLHDQTFNTGTPWPGKRIYKSANLGAATVTAGVVNNVGTIDSYSTSAGTATPAFQLQFTLPATQPSGWWLGAGSGFGSNLLTISPSNTEARLAFLNLSFDLSVSSLKPVEVKLASYNVVGPNANGYTPTGTVSFLVTPHLRNVFKRYTFDLSQATATSGTFDPLATRIELAVNVSSGDAINDSWPAGTHTVSLENVTYASPARFVNSAFTGTSTGSETNPHKTITAAINAAVPGDVIMVRSGTYFRASASYEENSSIVIDKPGAPSKWIVLRNYPGELPKLVASIRHWNILGIGKHAAYIEIRGLNFEGLGGPKNDGGAFLAAADTDAYNPGGTPLYNANAISITTGARGPDADEPVLGPPHHIRIIGNTMAKNSGAGLAGSGGDYITVEGNTAYWNAFYTRYGASGFSLLETQNFHTGNTFRNFVIGNNAYENESMVDYTFGGVDYISDGNGIIIDRLTDSGHTGTVLVQNNLASRNGGAGINVTRSPRVIITNNTLYYNVRTAELRDRFRWASININGGNGIRIFNNIVYAHPGGNIVNSPSPGLYFGYNLYFGTTATGGTLAVPTNYATYSNWNPAAPTTITPNTNLWATPRFVNVAGTSAASYTLRLQSTSPAIDAGWFDLTVPGGAGLSSGVPRVDYDGDPRPLVGLPGGTARVDIGAFEY